MGMGVRGGSAVPVVWTAGRVGWERMREPGG